ncbi:type VII secretion protein EccE [Actinophytocola oryzae]|uniref:Type VII secretion protein EccE n=1 Tax=Actinophytocola oryzae TaxID=502181 RepID=A0A4R7UTU1_9PSEU|nr:type VII secretion protein EccE [Actinophytocola oryzae]TDV40059.1 type VII secretion protein EccE [Actinophytocola oryzae]
MDATPRGNALAAQRGANQPASPTAATPVKVAPPLRIGAAAAARAAARPLVQAAPETDLHTRPLLLSPPILPARPTPVAPAAPTPPRHTWTANTREYVRKLSPMQVICWQVAALGVLLTVRQPWPVLSLTSAGAAVLLAMTTVRAGGRWLYELVGLAASFFARPRRRDLPTSGGVPGTTLALLENLLPGATPRTVETSQGPAMAISHQGGLTATLKPRDLTPELLGRLPMPAALLPAAGDHLFGVQLVLHVGIRQDMPRRLLVAVHAARTVDTPVDAELTLALRNAMRRVRRALDRAGVPAQPLTEEQALSAIAGLAHVTGGRTEVREDWRFWRTGPVSQATYRLTGWGALTGTQARGMVSSLLAGVPGVASTLTLGARTERRGEPMAHATLRLAATTEAAVDAAAGHMTNRLAPLGVRLARLDGGQLSGVAASLPIGVFLP